MEVDQSRGDQAAAGIEDQGTTRRFGPLRDRRHQATVEHHVGTAPAALVDHRAAPDDDRRG